MNIIFYITAFLFSLGQLGRISFFNQQINFYLYEVALIINVFFLFLKYRLEPIKVAWNKFKPIFFFLGVLFFSLLISLSKYNFFHSSIKIVPPTSF